MIGILIQITQGDLDDNFIDNALSDRSDQNIFIYLAPVEGEILEKVKFLLLNNFKDKLF